MLSVETLDEIEALWNEQRKAEAALVSVTWDHIPALVEAGRAALRHSTD